MNINTMQLTEIWQFIEEEAMAHPEYIEGLHATYGVELSGEETGEYRISFEHGKVQITEGNTEDADCILKLSMASFKKLLEGNLNTTAAFMTGKLKVKGNIGLALKLENTLKKFDF